MKNVSEKAVGADVVKGVSPDQQLVKVRYVESVLKFVLIYFANFNSSISLK